MIETEYANTDFDLKSNSQFDALQSELKLSCRVLHYTHGEDGNWHSIVEAEHGEDSKFRNAEYDILTMLKAVAALSRATKAEFEQCYLREFNIGFHCGDSWAYVHQLSATLVRAVADAGCSIAFTLYPMREIDGTPKM